MKFENEPIIIIIKKMMNGLASNLVQIGLLNPLFVYTESIREME